MSFNPVPDDFPYIAGWAFWGIWMILLWGAFAFVYIKRWLKNRVKPCQHDFVFTDKTEETVPALLAKGYTQGTYYCDKCKLKLLCIRDNNK